MKLPENDIKKIAVFRALQLGDMLCVIPAIRSLRYAYPDAKIILLGLPWAASFVHLFNNYLDGFIHFPGYEGLPEQPYSENDFNKFVDIVQKENFDLVFQLQGNGTVVNDLMDKFNAKLIAGFYNNESYVDNELFIPYPDYGSEVWRHLKLMRHLGIDLQGSHLEFPLSGNDEIEYKKIYNQFIQQKYVIVHAGSRQAWRQWPPQYFAAVADYCCEKGFAVVLTGTSDEKQVTNELIKCMHYPAIDLTGKTSLGTVAALIKNASMLIANCTGVSHIAAALKTPSVIISMDGEPERWAPLNTVLHCVIDCSVQSNFGKVYCEIANHIKSLKEIKLAAVQTS